MDALLKLLDLVEAGAAISTDTRSLNPGDLFFALRGENFNGNHYAAKALEKGARMAVIDDEHFAVGDECLLVEDVLFTLQELARQHRLKYDIPVIGITGTNGKTTTKELLHNALKDSFHVLATQGNFNNHIGVPLTLLKLNSSHDLAIIEMGASEAGEIAKLCEIARPTSGLVTNVGKAHLEGFGSEEVICATKGGLYNYLAAHDGQSFIPEAIAGHPYFEQREYKGALYFQPESMGGKKLSKISMKEAFPFVRLEVVCERETLSVTTQLYGAYNFDNLVNVIKIADYYSVPCKNWKKGIEKYVPSNNRSQFIEDDRGNTVILDAYNANPSSVKQALQHFLQLDVAKEKVIILGDMLELGKMAAEEHLKIVRQLAEEQEVQVILVGKLFHEACDKYEGDPAHLISFDDTSLAKKWWTAKPLANKLILVKGSRGIALESLFT